jgi:hypothetical protein
LLQNHSWKIWKTIHFLYQGSFLKETLSYKLMLDFNQSICSWF